MLKTGQFMVNGLFIKSADIKKMGTVTFSPCFEADRDCPLFRIMKKKSADFMNNSGNLCYSRVEVAANARRRHMKLWFTSANGPQQSRSGEIGSLVE